MKRKSNKTSKNEPNTSKDFLKQVDPLAEREASIYESPIASREYILQCIEKCRRPPNFKQLLNILKIDDKLQKKALDNRLAAMVRDGQVKLINNRYQLITDVDLIQGEIIAHQDGYGFVKIGGGQKDLYLANYEMRKVLPGDIVQVLVQESSSHGGRGGFRKKTEAKIINVKSRKLKQLVGKIKEQHGELVFQPEDKVLTSVLTIENNKNIEIKVNQIVLAEITVYPEINKNCKVRVIEVIGDYFAPGLEIQTAIRRFEIPNEWPEEVLSDVESFSSVPSQEDSKGRLDLRNLPLVTIDGEDAKDFDDAVYCEQKSNGNFRLIVAIADVSSYVRPNSSLDKEAYLRGTSVYFPGQVIPMLPEILSNGLCSLKPNVDRLCFACELELDYKGKLIRYRFLPAIMNSKARLTYTKVADILINNNKETIIKYKKLVPYLQNLHKLFKLLNDNRSVRGAIDFDSTETMIEFDSNRKISSIHPVTRNDAHRLIEECMLLANVAAAHFCLKNKIPVLYRNHESPPEVKLENLQEFLKPLGLGLKKLPPSPKDLSILLAKTHNRPDNHVIQMVVLRSLSQALYEPDNKGHFGLAFEQYAHFTSPIRRYPDLLLHRQLHHYLATHKNWQNFAANSFKNLDKQSELYFKSIKSDLAGIGEHSSHTERRADDATRDVTSWLKCEYMQDKIGMTFTGVISGVTGFGVFVELDEVYVEGLVHVTDLGDDYYTFDERMHMLRGERTGKKYRIGDKITICIAKVDLDSRRMDFVLPGTDLESRAARKTRSGSKVSKFPKSGDSTGSSRSNKSRRSKDKDKDKKKNRTRNKIKKKNNKKTTRMKR